MYKIIIWSAYLFQIKDSKQNPLIDILKIIARKSIVEVEMFIWRNKPK